jgi:hypothetical protein
VSWPFVWPWMSLWRSLRLTPAVRCQRPTRRQCGTCEPPLRFPGHSADAISTQALAILAYYTPENNPSRYREAASWLDLALSDRE